MPDISDKLDAYPAITATSSLASTCTKTPRASCSMSARRPTCTQRVRSYFVDPQELSPKNRALVANISDIEFIVVGSEIEALILENEYIKRYQPKYNVRLRDDKNYPYIKVSLNEDFPRVYRVRNFRRDGDRYFGPYTSSGAVDATLDLMNKIFPFRTCRYDASAWAPPRGHEDEPAARLEAEAACRAPARSTTSTAATRRAWAMPAANEYDAVIRQVMLFLEGKHDEVLTDLRRADG